MSMKFISIPFVFLLLSSIFAGIVNLEVEFGKGDLSEVEVVQIGDTERGNSFSIGARGNQWYSGTVDSQGSVGRYSSIAVDPNNQVHISYYDYSNSALKYSIFDGIKWSTDFVDSRGNVGEYTSIAIDSLNQPHISYYDNSNYNLKYAFFNGVNWQTETVDSIGYVGEYTSLALDSNDLPHISYYDLINFDLKYTYNNGVEWYTETVDYQGRVGEHTSIALDSNNHPHISYYDDLNRGLRYTYYDGDQWFNETIYSEVSGSRTSIAIDNNDHPHISFVDIGNDDLKYAHWNGTAWLNETIDSQREVGYCSSLALDVKGNPHIAYYDNSNGGLKYVYYDGFLWRSELIDASVGSYLSMTLDDSDQPHISYESLNYYLKYATIDDDPPNLISDNSPDYATTGDEFNFKISASDNTEIDVVFINWTHGREMGIVNLSESGQYWKSTIRLDHTLTNMTYTIYIDDIMGNRFCGTLETVIISDNDPPGMEQPTNSQGYTGDEMTFFIDILDNIAVENVYFTYWTGWGSYNYSIDNNTGTSWNITIITPISELSLTYYFSAMDTSGNWANTTAYNVEIIDNDGPLLIQDLTSGQAVTGSKYFFQIGAWDQSGVASANICCSFDNNVYIENPMIYNNLFDLWDGLISVSINSSYIYYHFNITDSYGNYRLTPQRIIKVIDNIKPVVETGKDMVCSLNETVTFDGSGSVDNIGIVSYNWTFNYNGTPILLTGERSNFSFNILGVYGIKLTVTDEAGNIANDIFILGVKDITPPIANISLLGNYNYSNGLYIIPVNQKIIFSGRDSYDNDIIEQYLWRFKDNLKQVEREKDQISYSFSQPGYYYIMLTTTDRSGNNGTNLIKIDVIEDDIENEIIDKPKETVPKKIENDNSFLDIILDILLIILLLVIGYMLVVRFKTRKNKKPKVSTRRANDGGRLFRTSNKYRRRRKLRYKMPKAREMPGEQIFSNSTRQGLRTPPEAPINTRYSHGFNDW